MDGQAPAGENAQANAKGGAQFEPFVVMYFAANDAPVSAKFFRLNIGPAMLQRLKSLMQKSWPDGAVIAQVFAGRDQCVSEVRR
jgi:hypothetical protein